MQESLDDHFLQDNFYNQSNSDALLVYGVLTSTEKSTIWKNHIKFYLNNSTDDSQIRLLADLLNKINPNIFDDQRSQFMLFGESWLLKANNHFTRDELYNIVVNITPKPIPLNESEGSYFLYNNQNCGCKSTNSVFTLCGGIWSASEECEETGSCKDTDSGCGFFLLEQCNGQCSIPTPEEIENI